MQLHGELMFEGLEKAGCVFQTACQIYIYIHCTYFNSYIVISSFVISRLPLGRTPKFMFELDPGLCLTSPGGPNEMTERVNQSVKSGAMHWTLSSFLACPQDVD